MLWRGSSIINMIFTLSEKIPGKYIVQYVAAFSCYFLIITSGMLQGWPSPSLPQLLQIENINCTICLTESEGSWMASINMIGCVLGALIGALVGHHMGRRTILIISGAPFLASWIMIAFAKTSTFLFVARFIAGAADGLVYTVAPMYIGEISSPSIRGFLGCIMASAWIFGILIIDIIGSYTSIRTTALISSIFPMLAIVLMSFMPESPYYLLSKGKTDQAKRSLVAFSGTADIEDVLNRISSAVSPQAKSKSHYMDLFTKRGNRKGLLIVFILRTIQQLSGTTAFIYYAQNIFADGGDDGVSSKAASIIYFSVQFVVMSVSSRLIDMTGRRPILFLSITGSAVALFLEGTFFLLKDRLGVNTDSFSYIPLVSMVIFVVFFSLALQGIPIVMLGEIFAADVKAFALGIADIYYSILATLISKFFQITNDAYGLYVPFYFFALCCFCGLVLSIIFVPETKNKTLEEIQELLDRRDGGKIRTDSETALVD